MTDDLHPTHPPTSGDHRRAPAAWPVVASMAAIVGALLAMLLVPLQYERWSAPLRARIADVAEPARADITALQLALAVQLDDALPELRTDAARVRQVLGNLLSNAVKYTPRGAVSVTAIVAGRPAGVGGADCVRITVVDTGPGIPADRREYVFGEFSRLAGTAAPGAGLGLAISRRIARRLGGDLRVESPDAGGACLVFELPAAGGRLTPPAGADRVRAARS